jgi:hypothetical protein
MVSSMFTSSPEPERVTDGMPTLSVGKKPNLLVPNRYEPGGEL